MGRGCSPKKTKTKKQKNPQKNVIWILKLLHGLLRPRLYSFSLKVALITFSVNPSLPFYFYYLFIYWLSIPFPSFLKLITLYVSLNKISFLFWTLCKWNHIEYNFCEFFPLNMKGFLAVCLGGDLSASPPENARCCQLLPPSPAQPFIFDLPLCLPRAIDISTAI